MIIDFIIYDFILFYHFELNDIVREVKIKSSGALLEVFVTENHLIESSL